MADSPNTKKRVGPRRVSNSCNKQELDPRYRWYKITLVDHNQKPLEYVYRGLTAEESRKLEGKKDESAAELYVLQCCVLTEVDWDLALAGVIWRLIQEIYKVSGKSEEFVPFEEARAWSETPVGALEAAAIMSLPGVTLEILQNCDPSDYAKYLFLGRWMFVSMWNREPHEVFTHADDVSADIPPVMIPEGSQVENQVVITSSKRNKEENVRSPRVSQRAGTRRVPT